MRSVLLAALLVGLGVSLAACDAVGSDAEQARLTVRLTDAPFPFDLADSANVTITRIELLAAEGDGDASNDTSATETVYSRIVLYDGEPVALNLLDLRDGVDTLLVNGFTIPADGSYNRLRFFVGEDASVVFADGSVYGLKLPSAQQSGIKVTLPDYDLDGTDGQIDVLVDFNVEDSFVVRGNPESSNFQGFLFKPVLKVKSFDVQAAEDGEESDGEDADSGDDGESGGES